MVADIEPNLGKTVLFWILKFYLHIYTRVAKIKRKENINCCQKQATELWYNHFRKLLGSFCQSRKVFTQILYNPAIPLPSLYPREMRAYAHQTWTRMFIATLITVSWSSLKTIEKSLKRIDKSWCNCTVHYLLHNSKKELQLLWQGCILQTHWVKDGRWNGPN